MSDFSFVAPPNEGLRQAMAQARGRRFRTAGYSTTTVAAAFAVLLALAGGQSTQSLIEQPAPEQPAVTHVIKGTRSTTSVTPNQPTTRGALAGQLPTSPLGPTTSGPVAGEQSRSGTVTRTSSARRGSYVAGPIDRADNGPAIPAPCYIGNDPSDAATLCPSTGVSGDGSAASPFRFTSQLCSNRTNLTLLHYAGANEVDLVVSTVDDNGKHHEVWRWSRTNPNTASPHTLGLDAARCTTWAFGWTGVTSTGSRMPKGTYELRATFLAQDLKATESSAVSAQFTIS